MMQTRVGEAELDLEGGMRQEWTWLDQWIAHHNHRFRFPLGGIDDLARAVSPIKERYAPSPNPPKPRTTTG